MCVLRGCRTAISGDAGTASPTQDNAASQTQDFQMGVDQPRGANAATASPNQDNAASPSQNFRMSVDQPRNADAATASRVNDAASPTQYFQKAVQKLGLTFVITNLIAASSVLLGIYDAKLAFLKEVATAVCLDTTC